MDTDNLAKTVLEKALVMWDERDTTEFPIPIDGACLAVRLAEQGGRTSGGLIVSWKLKQDKYFGEASSEKRFSPGWRYKNDGEGPMVAMASFLAPLIREIERRGAVQRMATAYAGLIREISLEGFLNMGKEVNFLKLADSLDDMTAIEADLLTDNLPGFREKYA